MHSSSGGEGVSIPSTVPTSATPAARNLSVVNIHFEMVVNSIEETILPSLESYPSSGNMTPMVTLTIWMAMMIPVQLIAVAHM
mmetsp:Transcript_78147/g.150960  ORF Transcript_78147/g.150960 Transcript_78147/m.150960 type:complete len:83 (-) Transcript_78147:66-314(-)